MILLINVFGQVDLVSAQSSVKNLYLTQFSVEDGLSQGTVNSILADDNGFIWLATDNGLNIYDGYSVKLLSGPNNSFIDASVYFVKQDSLGYVWINVNEGVYRYHPKTNQYQLILANNPEKLGHYTVDVTQGENSQNEKGYWLATSKTISFYHGDKAKFQIKVDLSKELLEKNNIFQIKYHQQVLYIGTRVGVYAYHIKLNKWRKLPDLLAKAKLDNIDVMQANKSFTLHISEQGDLYIGTGDGVFSINVEKIKEYIIQGRDEVGEYKQVFARLSVWQFFSIDNQLYVASDLGLHVFNTAKQQGKLLFGISDYFEKTSNNKIISIAQDNSGIFWLGSESSGVYLWDPSRELIKNYSYQKNQPNSLSHNSVWSITTQQTDSKKIWVGTNNGLNLVDLKKNTVAQHNVVKGTTNQRQETHIYNIYTYKENLLLLSTTKGIVFYDTNLKQPMEFAFSDEVAEILAKDHYSVNLQEQRYLWLVYDEDITMIDLQTGQLDTLNSLEKVIGKGKVFSFIGSLPDSQTMLVTTNDSLWSYNLVSTKMAKLYQHPNVLASEWVSFDNWVIDKNNIFWLSYPTKGLLGLAYPSFKPKYFYNSKNSIIDNNIYSVLVDNEGDLWFSSHKGLFLLNADNQHIRNYTVADGLSASEFNAGARFKLANGQLVYGSMEGISIFDPLALKKKYQHDKINAYVTNINVISRQLDLPVHINQKETVLLNYDDVGIRFDFSTLSSAYRQDVIYEYQLTGNDQISYHPTKENRITFPSLSSGSHTLSVRAKSPITGLYSPTKEIKIRVSYAPWKSPFAYFIYVVILLVLILLWLQRRYQQKQLLLEAHEEVKFRENRLQLALIGSNSEVWDWQAQGDLMFGKRISQELAYIDLATAHTFAQHVELIHPEDKNSFQSSWRSFIGNNDLDETFSCTYRLKHVEGHWLWYKDLGKIVTLDDKNNPSRITGSYTNITQTRAEEVRSQYYGEAFKQTNEWVLIINDDFTEVTANQSLRNVFELPNENFDFTKNFMGLNEQRWRFFQHLLPSLKEGEHWRGEEIVITDSGEEFHVVVNINVGRGDITNSLHYVCVFTDISAQKSAEKELRYLANYDHLTDLPNRSLLLERIKHAMESSQRQKSSIALFYIDLDRFKQVNDSLGHDFGDLLLVEVGRRLSALLRVDDTVARIGGDEFVVLLESFRSASHLGKIAQKIIAAVEQPVLLQDNEVSIGASMGIALYPDDAGDSSALLRHADVAMYHAKQLGRNTFQFFTPRMNAEATERLTKESTVKQAYSNNEFFNHYQPIINSNTGKAVGFELLMRWQSKQGIVAPAGFISIAEELGLIIPMTEAALERGLIDLKKWLKQRPTLYLSVNLSPKHFAKESLVPYIAKLLKNYDVPPCLLKIEVTESALLSEPDKAIRTMNSLSELGVILALDDFGTGFSSLSYLKRLPLDIIKIDRSFVSGIGIEKADEAIVDATLVLAKRLSMYCIAEGVETIEQLEYLAKHQCFYIQGYLYCKPVNAETISDYLLENITELRVKEATD
ncbi:MAG: GGDEF-domain containing protein [Gammaproteobacteria bacterium]|nr:MAG: GGDEF-domain containing protein [Gammaproteobacteria bacterium]